MQKPKASVPPWLLTTIPFKPNKTAPLYFRGSIIVLNLFNAGFERKYPILEINELLYEFFKNVKINSATPSAVFKAIFPENPSVTTTSTIPLLISLPSTKP